MKRVYEALLREQLEEYDLMVFICGARQVGKTTLAQLLAEGSAMSLYMNWDNADDRAKILQGPAAMLQELLSEAHPQKPILILDEIHKFDQWSSFVKGIYDTYKEKIRIIVTGSARLDLYRRGGDSMMGRYFQYRMHPFSVAEILHSQPSKDLIHPPKILENESYQQLFDLGGFPKPFLSRDPSFWMRWQKLRHQQLINQDLRDISDVKMTAQLEVLAKMIAAQSGQLFNYSTMAKKIMATHQTVQHWTSILEELYYAFKIRPWSKNVTRSLLKNPKYYLWDWSRIPDKGPRVENFVASHLLKAVHFWNDTGQGDFALHFIRDKEGNEVDFLVTQNEEPFLLIEAKAGRERSISKSLLRFHKMLKPKYSLQVVHDMPHVNVDFRDLKEPKIFPLQTFLSQLV